MVVVSDLSIVFLVAQGGDLVELRKVVWAACLQAGFGFICGLCSTCVLPSQLQWMHRFWVSAYLKIGNTSLAWADYDTFCSFSTS